jgi:cell division protein FtsB
VSSGPRTSSIARPRRVASASSATAGDDTLFGDLTRPIRADRQLVTHRGRRWALGLGGVTVMAALLAVLFTLPVKNYLRQQDQIEQKQQELAVLTAANEQLSRDVARLATPDGAAEAARSELGVVLPGENRVSVLPTDGTALPLPAGWPYDAVAQIMAVRARPFTTTPSADAP